MKFLSNKNKTLTVSESALIGFTCRLLNEMNEPKRSIETEKFEKFLDTFDLNFCLASGEIIK